MDTEGKARIDLKLLHTQKSLIKQAAQLSGKSLTEFLVSSAEEKAIETIQAHEKILMSKRDKEVFFDAIMNPPEPSENLMRAAQDFKQFLKSQ